MPAGSGSAAADSDPYHAKVRVYLESRSEMSLSLLAYIDGKFARLDGAADAEERAALSARRDAVRSEADATLSALQEQEDGQALLAALGLSLPARERVQLD